MPLYKMSTKRISYQLQQQQQQHQQQQRRPPDVEEALSSMLWTPYERSSTTDTSSEDEDEQLNRQLKKSKSHYDYTSVPTSIPPLTPPPLPPLLPPPATLLHHPPSNIVAYIATTTTPPVRATSATSNCFESSSSSSVYYTTEDLCDPSVTIPLVPFSNLMLNANTTNPTTAASVNSTAITGNEATAGVDDVVDSDDEEVIYNDAFNNERTLAAATSSANVMSSYPFKNRLSFTSYGRIPGLTKWWSTSNNATTTTTTTAEQSPPLAEISSSATTTALLTSSLTDEPQKHPHQPPSYESLYKKPLRSLRQQQQQQQHLPQQHHHHINKHLNIFKPVLETLKANVTTITQGRFTSAITRCQDNNRVTNNVTRATTNNQTRTPPATTPTTLLLTTTSNNIGSSASTNSNLDNFLHEHCTPTQLVAETNVDNEHIINNNNNNTNCPITTTTATITEHTQSETPIRLQQPQTHEETMNHHQPMQCELKTTNTKSKQNQEHENKQNNNFIICQQQQTLSLEKITTTTQTEHNELGEEEYYEREPEHKKMNTITLEMNEYSRDLREHDPTTMNCHSNDIMVNTAAAADTSLFYDSSSAISLTRSFEANTSYTLGLTVGSTANECFKTGLEENETRNSTTYNLTPNKCLAELERLYAEFRASESLREKLIREKINSNSDNKTTENMRLNVPASTINSSASTSSNAINAKLNAGEKGEAKSMSELKFNPSTSSVFLTTTNSVTTLTNPCQRTPSLTIQVNQNLTNNNNNNSNNNINNNNNNNNDNESNGRGDSDGSIVDNSLNNEARRQHVVLNQAIVNTTTKNGVSVINCNYVNSNNNNVNNNINNNRSITNLCDIATNTTNQSIENINSNLNLNKNSTKNINSNSDSDNNFNDIQQHVVPKVLTQENPKENENPLNAQDALKSQRNSKNLQVNVIQVNEASKGQSSHATTSASSIPLQRTFTSTECQTDDLSSVQLRSPSTSRPLPLNTTTQTNGNNANLSRDQRRRDRRERRHLHHTASLLVAPTHAHPHPHPLRHGHIDRHSMPAPPLPPILHPPHLHPGLQQSAHNIAMLRPMLPDILHNHYPPPYSALPGMASASGHLPPHNGSPIPFNHPHPHPLHHPPHPPPQAPISLMGPPPPPPSQAGTTLLTSVISTVPIPGATPMVSDGRFTLPLPIIRRSPSERSGKGCCGQWFAGPPLRALIAVVALGGVACALGGAALGATGLAGPPSSHFTAALLMIGVGVVLVTVSGAAWRMTAPGGPPCLGLGSSVDLGRCGRRPCSRGGGAPQGLLYPEFQHRPPPPSYQASMQEYRLRLLLLDRDRQNGVVRGSSPPPTYRSHAGSLLRAPLTSTARGGGGGGGVIGLTGVGRCESSIGGSEYSFPPSYRSRNPTPGTISSERSIETEPSGRLLANEDIPEPLSVEQLSEYNSLQQRTISGNLHKHEQKRSALQMDTQVLQAKTDTNLNSDKKDDLVTIVTITPQTTNDNLNNGGDNSGQNNNNNGNDNGGNSTREQIEILAHL